jgi:hypothetical protein
MFQGHCAPALSITVKIIVATLQNTGDLPRSFEVVGAKSMQEGPDGTLEFVPQVGGAADPGGGVKQNLAGLHCIGIERSRRWRGVAAAIAIAMRLGIFKGAHSHFERRTRHRVMPGRSHFLDWAFA